MIKRTKITEYELPDEDRNSFGTTTQIAKWMNDKGIPPDAEIIYAGCGSHNIAFKYEVEITEVLDSMRDLIDHDSVRLP